MIEGRWHEATGGMTDTAVLVSVDMACFLGCRETGIMAGHAVIRDTRVTKGCRLETGGLVTVAAVSVRRHVEVGFSGGGITIMTGRAVVHDILVIKLGTGKGGGVMAYRAILGGRSMVGVHTFRCPGSIGYMTGSAVIHDAGMIEYGRLKAAAGHVTDITILIRQNVGGIEIFTLRLDTVMAGLAAFTHNVRAHMIDKSRGKTGGSAGVGMACSAILHNGDMTY